MRYFDVVAPRGFIGQGDVQFRLRGGHGQPGVIELARGHGTGVGFLQARKLLLREFHRYPRIFYAGHGGWYEIGRGLVLKARELGARNPKLRLL